MEPVQKTHVTLGAADPALASSLDMLAEMKTWLFAQFKKRSDPNGWSQNEDKALEISEKLARVIDAETRILQGGPDKKQGRSCSR